MKTGGEGTRGVGGTGLAPNIASFLCYICAPIPSIVFLIIEKENKDVLFHAWQGTLFGVASLLLMIIFKIFGLLLSYVAGFLGAIVGFLFPFVIIALVVLWIVCLFKAYQGERWKIPVLGDIAAQKAGV